MESILDWVSQNASHAYWFLSLLILLAGLNVPLSEDIILLTGGAIAGTYLESPYGIFVWLFLACWFSAWEAYWVGRALGPRLYQIRWFNRILTPQKIEKLHEYYEKFGILTFIVGRFIPGGVRNALFMTAGLGKMPFSTFIIRDGIGCFISVAALFYAGYYFAEHYELIISSFHHYQNIAFFMIAAGITIPLIGKKLRLKRSSQ